MTAVDLGKTYRSSLLLRPATQAGSRQGDDCLRGPRPLQRHGAASRNSGLAILLGVDRIPEIFRSATDVPGRMTAASVVDRMGEKKAPGVGGPVTGAGRATPLPAIDNELSLPRSLRVPSLLSGA